MPDGIKNQARMSRSELESLYNDLKEGAEVVMELAPELYEEASKMWNEVEEGIERASNIEIAGTTLGDLARTGTDIVNDISDGTDPTEAIIEHTVGSTIDDFLEEHANYEDTIFELSYNQSIPVYPPINADVGVSASMEAALNSSRDGATITCTGTATATARLSLGMSVGFQVAGYGLSIGAGVQGGPDFNSSISVSLGVSGRNLTGAISPLDIDLSMACEAYFGVSGVPQELIDWAAEQLGLSTSGNKILYPLGTVSILVITTPSYSITFDMAAGRFKNAKAEGQFNATVHPKLVAAVESVYNSLRNIGTAIAEGIVEVAGEVLEGVVDLAENTVEAVEEMAENVAETAESVGDYVAETADSIISSGRQAVERTSEYLEERYEEVSQTVNEVVDYGEQVVENMSETAQQSYQAVEQLVDTVYDEGREFIGEVSESVTEAAVVVYDTVNETANDLYNSASGTVESMGDAVSDFYSSVTSIDYNPFW